MSLPLLVTGTFGIDTIITPNARADEVLGGSAAFAAIAAALFTKQIDVISIIGADFPHSFLSALQKHGIGLNGIEHSSGESFRWTGEYFANMNKRRTLVANDDVMVNWNVHVPETLQNHAVIANCCMVPARQLRCLEQCNPKAVVISDSMDKWLHRQPNLLAKVIQRSCITLMNEEEAKTYAHSDSLIAAGEYLLAQGTSFAIIKQGEYGASLFHRSPSGELKIFRCPAYPLRTVIDPTGAGDTFLGALAGYLSNKCENPIDFSIVQTGVVLGTVAASFTCEAFSAEYLLNINKQDFIKRLREYTTMCAFPYIGNLLYN